MTVDRQLRWHDAESGETEEGRSQIKPERLRNVRRERNPKRMEREDSRVLRLDKTVFSFFLLPYGQSLSEV